MWIGAFKPNSQNIKCILSKLLHRFQPNFAQWKRSPNVLHGWSKHAHNRSKRVYSYHFEKDRKIAISQQWFNRLLRNLVRWRKLTLSTLSTVKISNFSKSMMADDAILKNRKIIISQRSLDRSPQNLTWWRTLILLTLLAIKIFQIF